MFQFSWTKRHTTLLFYVCGVALASILLLFLLLRPGIWMRPIAALCNTLSPVLFGFAIAYLLAPLAKRVERLLKKIKTKKENPRLLRVCAILLTYLIVIAVLALFIGMILPQIRASYHDLETKAGSYLDAVTDFVTDFLLTHMDTESGFAFSREDILANIGKAIDTSFDYISDLVLGVISFSSQLITLIAEVFVSLLFSAFFLYEREALTGRISALSAALLPENVDLGLRKWLHCTDEIFGGFLIGKALDSLLIGVINFIVFGLCGIPYYPLIALINGVTNIIPYFGPFIGAIPSTLLILIANPIKAIPFILLTLGIQQLDGNFIGPRILGDTLGIDSLTIILAITVSSELFGIAGLFLGVPIFAVLYRMVKESTETRLARKELPTETTAYMERSDRREAKTK